jgi:hypothetical protein
MHITYVFSLSHDPSRILLIRAPYHASHKGILWYVSILPDCLPTVSPRGVISSHPAWLRRTAVLGQSIDSLEPSLDKQEQDVQACRQLQGLHLCTQTSWHDMEENLRGNLRVCNMVMMHTGSINTDSFDALLHCSDEKHCTLQGPWIS